MSLVKLLNFLQGFGLRSEYELGLETLGISSGAMEMYVFGLEQAKHTNQKPRHLQKGILLYGSGYEVYNCPFSVVPFSWERTEKGRSSPLLMSKNQRTSLSQDPFVAPSVIAFAGRIVGWAAGWAIEALLLMHRLWHKGLVTRCGCFLLLFSIFLVEMAKWHLEPILCMNVEARARPNT